MWSLGRVRRVARPLSGPALRSIAFAVHWVLAAETAFALAFGEADGGYRPPPDDNGRALSSCLGSLVGWRFLESGHALGD